MADKKSDDRFSKVFSDPKFRTLRKTDKTLKIDNRFKSMFTEDKFKLKYSMDKRGKSKKHLISEDYKKFYRLSDEEDEDAKKEKDEIQEDNDHQEESESALPESQTLFETKLTHKLGYHRGIDHASDEDASSSSSSESEESEDEEEEFEHKWGELDKDATEIDHATPRIAICNADWDRINAQDLFVLLNSFKRATGAIHSVSIFFSKFGEERLKVEDAKGPSEFIFGKTLATNNVIEPVSNSIDLQSDQEDELENEKRVNSASSNESDDQDDDEEEATKDSKAMEKLRKYQLERMKYFYAVVEFDSAETAEVIYNELDGMEYESSSTTIDIRFIPEDMAFDDVKLKEKCTSMPDSNSYTAPAFINTALQQSKVKLTWDETDPKRKDAFEKAFEQDKEDDLKAYLASSSDESNDDEINIDHEMKDDDKIDKYKDLLKSLDNDKDDDFEMEVTWDPSLKSTAEDIVNKKESDSKLNANQKSKSAIKPLADSSDESDHNSDEDLVTNDLVSESDEEEKKQTQRDNSKEKYKKWKNKKRNSKVNNDLLNADSSNLELLMVDIEKEGPNKKHFNYKEIVDQYSKKEGRSTKAKSAVEPLDSFKFDAEDPRFRAIYTSHIFNVDQSDPNFKKTEAFEQILNRRKNKASQMINEEKSSASKQEIGKVQNKSWASLVRKVKDKTDGELVRKRQVSTKLSEESKFNTNKKFRR